MHSEAGNPNAVEDTAKRFNCTFCQLSFGVESALKRHVRHDHQSDSKSSESKNVESNLNENQTRSIKPKRPKNTASYCQICQQEFSSNSNLLRHNQRKHFEPEKSVSTKPKKMSTQTLFCRLCDSGFDSSAALMDHHVQSHVNTVAVPEINPSENPETFGEKSKPVNEESYCHICQYQVSVIYYLYAVIYYLYDRNLLFRV